MQAAVSLRKRGFQVILYEKEAELGGFMTLAGVPPHKEQIIALRNYMVRELYKSGAETVLNYEFTSESLMAAVPDVLVIATGSRAVRPPIKGGDQNHCIEAVDVLGKKIEILAQKVIIIGGGSTGCEAAEYLQGKGNQVTILESGPFLAADMEKKNRRALMNSLEDAGVVKRNKIRVDEITADSVKIEAGGSEEILPADWVVWSTGFKPQNDLFKAVEDKVPHIFIIGDALKVRGFKEAILEGEMLGDIIAQLFKKNIG
jgi:pyruvate/2-oxoglutarate dehydrogenase complex dihydrolipoamide dehydrogenase (E3) component